MGLNDNTNLISIKHNVGHGIPSSEPNPFPSPRTIMNDDVATFHHKMLINPIWDAYTKSSLTLCIIDSHSSIFFIVTL